MAEVTLLDALEGIQSTVAKNRNKGYSDLKHIVRHNQTTLKDKSYHAIYDVLFRAAVNEQSNLANAKTTSTRTLVENKLSSIASTLRTTVEVGAAVLKPSTARAVLDHVIDTICFETGEVCEPIGPDYAKCMRAILGHQPHVELMNQVLEGRNEKEWDRIAAFCTGFIQSHSVDDGGPMESGLASTAGSSTNSLSYRSSRTTVRESAASQGTRAALRLVTDELIACVRLLTVVPNAPLKKQAEALLHTLIEYLRTSHTATRSHLDVFAAVNQLLSWTRTESIQLTQKVTAPLLHLIKVNWSAKSPALPQMTTTILLLRPYVYHALGQPDGSVLPADIVGLLQIMQSEYANRHEREQLGIDDLRLGFNTVDDAKVGKVATTLFALRCSGSRSESGWLVPGLRSEPNWLLVHILASLYGMAMKQGHHDSDSNLDEADADDDSDVQRPKKRQRRNGRRGPGEYENLLEATTSGAPRSRTCALQILVFLAQQTPLTPKQITEATDCLAVSCNEEAGNLSSWALLALASCASQVSASNRKLVSRWNAAWQLACRALGNASTCRAASYGLYVMLQLRLVSQTSIADLVQTATNAMELSGPGSLSDSVALLLTAVLSFSQHANAESNSGTTDSILRWLVHTFTPSKIEDKQYNTGAMLYEVADIVPLITLCLGRSQHEFKTAGFPVWGPIARAWLSCAQQRELVAYLLLNNIEDSPINPATQQLQVMVPESSAAARSLSGETIVLTHMLTEATRANDAWAALFKERARNPSHDSFVMLCKACHVFTCISSCIDFRDARRQSQLQEQTAALTKSLSEYVGATRCDEAKADSFLSVLSMAFSGLEEDQTNGEIPRLRCETLICRAATIATGLRREANECIDDNDDAMDIDAPLNSQDSRLSQASSSSVNLANDFDVTYSYSTLRASTALYATVVVSQENEKLAQVSSSPVSTTITDFLLAQPVNSLLASRNVIAMFPRLGLILNANDVERLLELFGDLLSKPKHYRSEVTLGTIIDVMQSTADVWTYPNNRQLYYLGLQLYEWYSITALPEEILSRNTQKRLATLLLRLCQIDTGYPQHSEDTSARSCLSSLFDLLRRGSITVQFHLASHISAVFGRSVLSTHAGMFEDLSESLPDEMDHVEGMAIRLLFFVKLASKWKTLLRWCVYRIFEAGSTPHAARCINELASNLGSRSPQKLFTLFAPHLLFKWLAPKPPRDHLHTPNSKLPWPLGMGMALKELPYSAFQYSTLNELLVANQPEVCAQVVMFGDKPGMELLSKATKMLPQGLVKSAFARSLAYAMAYDIRISVGLPTALRDRESYVRDLVGGKEVQTSLTRGQWSAIQGHFYLTTQQDDAEDRWLERQSNFSAQLSILKEMKQYSHSARQLPDSQEPAFTSTKLCEQIDRLNRRVKADVGWTSSRFTLAARMLLDAVDDSLGSLHSCILIRRLRILICMAGEVALGGFALEMLIHSLRPFMSDSECADDTLGMLQYLFNNGREHLRSNPSFLAGTVTLLVLQLRQHSKSRQSSTTQESQHTATVHKMLEFQKWLVKYLAQATSESQRHSTYDSLSKALDLLQLPGNAYKDTPESALLVFLLDQWSASAPVCNSTDCFEALCLLAEGFKAPKSTDEDVFGVDETSVKYAQPLWEVSSKMVDIPTTQDFTAWSARVVGRAYASTGIRPAVPLHANGLPKLQMPSNLVEEDQLTANSHMVIAQSWSQLLFSRKRMEAGLAEHTLRKLAEIINTESNEAGVFSTVLPRTVYVAILDGTCGYEPPSADQRAFTVVKDDALRQSLQLSTSQTLEEWTTELAVTVCRWAPKVTVIACLAPLLQKIPTLAMELLPSMLHILLVEEIDGKPIMQTELSTAITSQLQETDPALYPKQQFWLKLMLYLRSQPYPREATKADRLRWLDVDYLIASDAGSRCAMPQCGLLLAESIAPIPQTTSKRSSSRASLSQLVQPPVPDDLLLSIYKQLEEPDSFYGVEQPASLDNVLSRLDHEANGLRSLMFRSAQMDSRMRQTHRLADSDAVGMVHSLSALNFNSLALALLTHGLGNSPKTSRDLMDAAQALQQWDVALPETSAGSRSTTYSVFQELSRASSLPQVLDRLQIALIDHAQRGMSSGSVAKVSPSWFGVLASLTETEEILSSLNAEDMASRWSVMRSRSDWMHMAQYDDIKPILSNRHTLFGVLVQNTNLQQRLHLNQKQARGFEVEALLAESRFAREHSHLQEALAATTTLSDMVPLCDSINLSIAGAVQSETASVLWEAGETSASVRMLRNTLNITDVDKQDAEVGLAGLRAQLAHMLAEARLEKPDVIYKSYLKPAISDLKSVREGIEAGNVFYEFAKFCDDELQVPANIEAFNRISQLRQEKEEEVEAIENALRKSRSGTEKQELSRSRQTAAGWRDLDILEEQRLKSIRSTYVQQSLQNYLLTLAASDDHDICVLRFFALWLEYSDDADANAVVLRYLPRVPSWKFVLLMNQLMSRVGGEQSTFQTALSGLMLRIFTQHPHHSLHHLFANTKNGSPTSSEAAAVSRYDGSRKLYEPLKKATIGPYMMRLFNCDLLYKDFANSSPTNTNSGGKFSLDHWQPSKRIRTFHSTRLNIPPITLTLPLRPSGEYNDVPTVIKFKDTGSILGGVSAPKLITAIGSDGKEYKQIFKNGRDDLRQDAIMEQVFEEVSKMLRHHKPTRQRDLKIRTYKVIPLGPGAGVIEFVPNSIPLMEYLRPAHQRYHPQDLTDGKARSAIKACDRASDEVRVQEFRKVCERIHPVLRHFFLERFDNPDEWFEKRTAYTRTTASVSILGHIIGLGDRHCSNILLDEMTGEVIHIDLGVSFEAGRVLPIPEKVPFRLTRDIVDGMGVTKTEGVFRRCCEFTLDAVRDDKDSIMTLLNVLRYDPLYNWTVSPLRAKRMQEAEETGRKAGEESELSSKKGGHDGEADRPLQVVEKKLSKMLSTAATVNELIQQAADEQNLATLFVGWGAYF